LISISFLLLFFFVSLISWQGDFRVLFFCFSLTDPLVEDIRLGLEKFGVASTQTTEKIPTSPRSFYRRTVPSSAPPTLWFLSLLHAWSNRLDLRGHLRAPPSLFFRDCCKFSRSLISPSTPVFVDSDDWPLSFLYSVRLIRIHRWSASFSVLTVSFLSRAQLLLLCPVLFFSPKEIQRLSVETGHPNPAFLFDAWQCHFQKTTLFLQRRLREIDAFASTPFLVSCAFFGILERCCPSEMNRRHMTPASVPIPFLFELNVLDSCPFSLLRHEVPISTLTITS